jgi:hypothetical protein
MKIDMSAKAIAARLRMASQLRDLCLSLGKAKPVEKEPSKEDDSNSDAGSLHQAKELKESR